MMPLPPTQAGNGNHKETVVLISKAYWGEAVDYEKKTFLEHSLRPNVC